MTLIGLSGGIPTKSGGWWAEGAQLDFDFVNRRAYNRSTGFKGLPKDILTVSRASGGGRWGQDGKYVWDSTNNTLRHEYDPVSLLPLGLLVEEQRTNLLLRSQEIDNASWGKISSTVTANAATSPDGTSDAESILSGSAYQDVTISANGTYTASLYVKPSDAVWFRLFVYETAATANRFTVWANLSTGVLGTVSNGGTGSGAVGSITAVGNGWYRLVVKGAVNNSATAVRVQFGPTTADNNTTLDTKTTYVWGAQLEAGSFATSYIPTTSSQVTRSADAISIATSAFAFGASEGTVVAQADAPNVTTANAGVFALGTSTSVLMRYFRQNDAQPVFQVVDTTTQATLGLGATWAASAVKSAMAYKANDFAASKAGNAVVTDVSGSVPSVSSLVLGSAAGIGALNGHIRRLTYWNTRKTNSELQALAA